MGLGVSNHAIATLRDFAFGRLHGFPMLGWGGRELWERFSSSERLELSRGPHRADLLVLAGEIPVLWQKRVRALFETVPLPRLAIWLQPDWDCQVPTGVPIGDAIRARDHLTGDWRRIRAELLNTENVARQPLLKDQPPSPWRGLGDHGQGGEGMMGGKPYGRRMAMTADDVDDLSLDDVPTAVGPHFPGLPSGLQLNLRLQGDRVRAVEAIHNRFPPESLNIDSLTRGRAGFHNGPALRALLGPSPQIAELELARVRSHLTWMADLLALGGREGLGSWFRHAAAKPEVPTVAGLIRRAERTGLKAQLRGVGVIENIDAIRLGLTGPVARASGATADARADDPDYADLGFTMQTEAGGDVWARWRVRARECLHSLELIQCAGDRAAGCPEGPRGTFTTHDGELCAPTACNLGALREHLAGMEWFEAILFIASLDLDMPEAALR